MNPNNSKNKRFNAYVTANQGKLLDILSQKTNRSKTELVREALHFWFRGKGFDDGEIYDRQDFWRRLAKEYPWLKEK